MRWRFASARRRVSFGESPCARCRDIKEKTTVFVVTKSLLSVKILTK
jgi:hypothetical protein